MKNVILKDATSSHIGLSKLNIVDPNQTNQKGGFVCYSGTTFYTRHTILAGYYGFTLDVHVSVRPSAVHSNEMMVM